MRLRRGSAAAKAWGRRMQMLRHRRHHKAVKRVRRHRHHRRHQIILFRHHRAHHRHVTHEHRFIGKIPVAGIIVAGYGILSVIGLVTGSGMGYVPPPPPTPTKTDTVNVDIGTPSVSNLTVTVNASASPTISSDSIVGFSTNFGDGYTASGMPVSHTYSAAGSYTIDVTATDNTGVTGSASTSVTVTAPVSTPTNSTLSVSETTINVGDSVTFTITGLSPNADYVILAPANSAYGGGSPVAISSPQPLDSNGNATLVYDATSTSPLIDLLTAIGTTTLRARDSNNYQTNYVTVTLGSTGSSSGSGSTPYYPIQSKTSSQFPLGNMVVGANAIAQIITNQPGKFVAYVATDSPGLAMPGWSATGSNPGNVVSNPTYANLPYGFLYYTVTAVYTG